MRSNVNERILFVVFFASSTFVVVLLFHLYTGLILVICICVSVYECVMCMHACECVIGGSSMDVKKEREN